MSLLCASAPLEYLRSKRCGAQGAHRVHDLGGDSVGGAHIERAVLDLVEEALVGGSRPAALATDATEHGPVVRPELRGRLLVGVGDVSGRVDRQGQRVAAELAERVPVQVGDRREARGIAADDGQRHRQVQPGGADHRLGGSADADAHRDPATLGLGVDLLVGQRGARGARPRHRSLLEQRHEQLELLHEQHVVVGQRVAEEREGLGERAAAGRDLRAALRQRIERWRSARTPGPGRRWRGPSRPSRG